MKRKMDYWVKKLPKDLSLFDSMDWVQNNITEDEGLYSLANYFGEIRIKRGMTPSEVEKYEEVFEISEDSSVILKSYCVSKSQKVKDSCWVMGSENVDWSSQIHQSKKIYQSEKVEGSSLITHGTDISKSALVGFSKNISDSEDIFYGEDIENSLHIFYGKDLKNCFALFEGENCESVCFSREMKNCDYCLFCSGLNGEKFHIFNQPVSEKDFFITQALVLATYKYTEKGNILFLENNSTEWCGFKQQTTLMASPYHTREFYENLSDEFIRYVRSIPVYNDWLFYHLTMNMRVLDDKI